MRNRNKSKTYVERVRSRIIEGTNLYREEKDIKDEEDKTLEIIEVSNIKRSKILKENSSIENSSNHWIKRLIIPYERSVMGVEQIKKETVAMFEELCKFVDQELKHKRGSLSETIKNIARKEGYYNNILYTIYCIAEGHITKAYSGSYDYYNSDFSYDVFQVHLGEDLKYKVYRKSRELEENISAPDEETLRFFKLTRNGFPVKWWDEDGELRTEMDLKYEDLGILNLLPVRSTKAWEVYSLKKEIIKLYLKIWEIIADSFEKDLAWNKDKKKILENIKKNKYKTFLDQEHGYILISLIKEAENAVRAIIPNMQMLNVKREKINIQKYLPKEVVEEIDSLFISYKEEIKTEKLLVMIDEILKRDSKDWKLITARILMEDEGSRVDELIKYEEDKDFLKISKKIIDNTEDERLLILCLYGMEIQEDLNRKNIGLLKTIIHSTNISRYEKIIESKESLSLDLLNKLLELRQPIRRRIRLNRNKINNSKEELKQTVNIVNEYIAYPEESEDIYIIEDKGFIKDEAIEENIDKENKKKIKFKYKDFLKLVLNSGPVKTEKGKKIAMENNTLLNAFISNVNQELYEYIEDQTIIIEEDFIKIDDFYIDIVRELVMNE